MDEFIERRRKEWKNSFIKKIKDAKDIHTVIEWIISEYIYYSRRIREIKTRTKRIIKIIEHQMENIPITREDIDPKALEKIKDNLQTLKRKL